jgi:hypothetical protein
MMLLSETRRKHRRYRERAHQLRAIAQMVRNENVRSELESLANDYDGMADSLERRLGHLPHAHAGGEGAEAKTSGTRTPSAKEEGVKDARSQ